MGVICGSNLYSEVKKKYPQDFITYLQMKEASKQIEIRKKELIKYFAHFTQDLKNNNAHALNIKQK